MPANTQSTPEEWLERVLDAIMEDGGDLNGGHDYTVHTLAVIRDMLKECPQCAGSGRQEIGPRIDNCQACDGRGVAP